MIGGKRENAGRKVLPEEIKKKGFTIYLNKELQEKIDNIVCGNSFSNKCTYLIEYAIQKYQEEEKKTIRFIDLFAGLGGIRIGFESAMNEHNIKTECVFSSEIKKYAISAYKKYFEEERIYGDITEINTCDIPDFDFLLAGFPCQPFSSAGNRLGFKDTRGTLFFEIERILKEKQPYGFILENVEGLIQHNKGETLKVIIDSLIELGYQVNYKLIDSVDFGLAQSRKRVYIVGTKDSFINLDNFVIRNKKFKDIQENLKNISNSAFGEKLLSHYDIEELYGKSIKDKRGGNDNIHSWDIEIKGKVNDEQRKLLNVLLKERRKKKWAEEISIQWMDGMPLTKKQIETFYFSENLQDMLDDLVEKKYLVLEYPKKLINGKRVYDEEKEKGYNIVSGKLSFEYSKIIDPNSITPTLVATDVSKLGVIDNGVLRQLSVREGQRLFGFPEDYDLQFLKYNEAMDLLGNTVCIPVIKDITDRIIDVSKSSKQFTKISNI